MKATGITRKIDELGRIVIPRELCKTLDIKAKDPMEIFTDEDSIILKKYSSTKACIVTGEVSDSNLTLCNGRLVLSLEGAEMLVKELSKVEK